MKLDKILKRNRELRDRHAGRRAFVIGNGPSLRSQDLSWLRHEVTFTVNSFHRAPVACDVASPYHVLADPVFWQEPQEHLLPVLQSFQDLSLPKTLFMPSLALPVLGRLNAGPAIDVRYFHYDEAADQPAVISDLDFTSGVPQFGQTVTICALMVALYMGCNPIYLIGCDHDWFAWRTPEEFHAANFPHLYSEPEETAKHSAEFSFEQITHVVKVMRYQYTRLREYAQARGIAIRNATAGGHLDVFSRVAYENLAHYAEGSLSPDELVEDVLPSAQELTRVVRKLLADGDAGAALMLARDAVRRRSGHFVDIATLVELEAEALDVVGLEAHARGRRSDALTLRKHEELSPSGLTAAARRKLCEALVARGEAWSAKNAEERARSLFRDALRIDPNHAPAWNNLGVLYVSAGEPRRARAFLERAVALDPNDVSARENLAAVGGLLAASTGGDVE